MIKNTIWLLSICFMIAGMSSCSEDSSNADDEALGQDDTLNDEADVMADDEGESMEDEDLGNVIDQDGVFFLKESWQNALAKAKKEDKPIFLDAYADWCRPCKEMDREVFSQNKVGEFFNEHFVSVKLNIDEGDGLQLSEEYNIDEIPKYLFFTPEGELINELTGKMPAETLINKAREIADIKT